jgi:uncharacterized protein (TIGR02118 family)
MTARFLAVYDTPADPERFDRHYREIHIPLGLQLPGLRRYMVSRDIAALRGDACYMVAELEWDTMDDLRAAFALARGARHRRRRGPAAGTRRSTQHGVHHAGRPHTRSGSRATRSVANAPHGR